MMGGPEGPISGPRHPLLERDLADTGGSPDVPPSAEVWEDLLARISKRYDAAEAERQDLERVRKEVVEARQAAQAAFRSEKGRAQFIANLSHELRTPLNAILGYAELVREELSDRAELELYDDVRRIERAGRTLLELINDVIDLAKIDAGRMKLTTERFDAAPILAEVVEELMLQHAWLEGALLVDVPKDLGFLTNDPGRVRQCVHHLLVRAIRAADGKRIELVARREGPALAVVVHDQGPALTRDQQADVFAEFADPTPHKADGAGLGLALTRRFVELMGGAVDVLSDATGTTFTLRVPDHGVADSAHAAELLAQARAMPSNDPSMVLFIDDDKDMQDLVRRLLEKEGFRVAGAADGESGIVLARRLKPRAIVLDLILPGRSGWEVLSKLKSDPELAQIPVVVLSTVDDRSRGLSLGADEYLIKPVDRERLVMAVRRFMRGSGDVLVVDDDFGTRRLLRQYLERAGLEARTAAHGEEALAMMRQQLPGLVVLDLVMPVMDGLTFLRRMREDTAFDGVPVVVTTAKDLTDEERQVLEASVSRVLTKHGHSLEEVLSHVVALVR
ncbi:MAG: response regulator [Alphaproteobacteria bacterium]|nr:response regulator [Alphaproteobacteria bacterium]MCB9699392.1 response regulator [Alphaproteobacteria bacterium]